MQQLRGSERKILLEKKSEKLFSWSFLAENPVSNWASHPLLSEVPQPAC